MSGKIEKGDFFSLEPTIAESSASETKAPPHPAPPIGSTKGMDERKLIPLAFWEGSSDLIPADADKNMKNFAAERIGIPFPFDATAFRERKEKFIETHTLGAKESDKLLITKAVNAVQHISFDELLRGLDYCITAVNGSVGDHPYKLYIEGNSSNEWITKIALKKGLRIPVGISRSTQFPSAEAIVFFDDCSYSGKQMRSFIEQELIRNERNREANPALVAELKKVIIAIPFTSTIAEKRFGKLSEDFPKIEIQLITSETRLKTVKETITEEELPRFREIFPTDHAVSGLCIAFTDWRCADGTSVPESLVPYLAGPIIKPYGINANKLLPAESSDI